MLTFCDFIQVYVFTTNHHLKVATCLGKSFFRFIVRVWHFYAPNDFLLILPGRLCTERNKKSN